MCEEVTMTPAECEIAAWERLADWCEWIQELYVKEETTTWEVPE
jgi:hypothetical protein